QEIKRLYQTGNYTYPALAKQFATTRRTIAKWVKRDTTTDRSSAPQQHGRRRVTEAYRQAVIAYRQAHPTHGPVRIQAELEATHGHFAFSTVRLIVKQAALSQAPKPKATESKAIPVGRHRTQMDVQQLPAIEGSSGFEYKISIIHLSTRIKYSEIHDNYESATIAAVFQRAWDALPPFLLLSLTTP
ncbi:helix-turn-helix domain-containing protein, partial [Spirosoma endbachense]|uniref:helix-turn-helix domain-containing protein n=1 Tax=Spirosoma endbachense TaxID=2666025 RepID=UPI0018E0AD83